MSTAQVPTLDMNKLNAFIGQFVTDLGAAVHTGMVVIGERLGLYKALAGEPMTPAQLAARTKTDERYLREWLASQAAGGYVTYDDKTGKFGLNEEQAFTLAKEDSPAYLPGAFELALGSLAAVPRIADSFRTGSGMGWHEHADGVFHGCEKFFRPGYAANLVSAWIPALSDVKEKLEAGAKVADVGCGLGASTILMAQAFPKSKFFGFDYHDKSIEAARESAQRAGVADRVTFEVSKAKEFPGKGYDFVAVFDCLHDMGDPIGAAAHVRQSLAKDGTWMIVEPFANDQLKDNLNPVGRVYYSFSTLLCTPCSRSQEVGLCLGAQAGEASSFRIGQVAQSSAISNALGQAADTSAAEALATKLNELFPEDTFQQRVLLPVTHSTIQRARGNLRAAVDLLSPVTQFPNVVVFYNRARAYMAAGDEAKAVADVQTVIDNPGWPDWELFEPLSQLGLAQAYAKQGDSENSRKAYDDFFATWKDADPNIPILKQAKAEYAKLR